MAGRRSTPGKAPARGSNSTSPSPNPRLAGTPITAPPDAPVLRVFPEPAVRLAVEDVYADISFPEREAPPSRACSDDHLSAERPYVLINMVSSLDGKAAVGGKAGFIGGPTDRVLMRNLRARADAVMVGAGTLRAEKLTLGVPEGLAAAREARGIKPQPLAVVVTGSGDVPLRTNLLGFSPDNLLVLASPELPRSRFSTLSSCASVEVVPKEAVDIPEGPASPGTVSSLDLVRALGILRRRYAVELLLVEGGAVLNHALISSGLADELFLTIAPKLLGGRRSDSLTVLEGPALSQEKGPRPKLVSVYLQLSGDELFLRYALLPNPGRS